ncbi:MAG: MgtC/SapB family protein [Candidatus Micrarchaeota archaeon]|nr:MgtC/SapB family protein [Candidatus Micrarchaeota archaeon]
MISIELFLFNLFICFLLGYLVGLEREHKQKPAGVGTHIIIISSSMTFSSISLVFLGESARVIAAIISGIGFLGAGIIFREKTDKITNLTTAATIWLSASIGILIGLGYYLHAFILTLFELIALNVPHLSLKKNN